MYTYAVAVMALTASISAATGDGAPVDTQRDDQTIAELRAAVADLKGQVDALKAQSNASWLTEARAQEIRSLVQDVLADADTRASLLQSDVTAGWDKDKGFFIASSDGNYLLRIGGQLQIRYVYNNQDDSPSDDNRSGFELRRSKLILRGNVVDPTWQYEAQFNSDRATGVFVLEDAGWIQKDFGSGWKVTAGQMKAPFLREEILSSQRLLAVERSLVNSFFTAGTVQGVRVGWQGDNVRLWGMYHDGNRSLNTAWNAEDTEFAFSGRAEFLLQGAWKTLEDYNSFKDDGHGLVLGAAANYSRQEFGNSVNDTEVDNLGLTADATLDLGGISAAGAVMYRSLDSDAAGFTGSDQIGFLVRGGVFLTDSVELYAQYEWADADTAAVEDLNVITVGVTKYFNKHGLKWQSDIGFALDPVSAAFAQESAGWRADSASNDGQVVFRSQFQLLF
jgi:hypothetical protein